MLTENLVDYIERSIKRHWECPAFSDFQGKTLTYGEVAAHLHYLHTIFRKSHLKPGDKIAVIGRNSVNWGITYFAALTYGAVIVPILHDFPPENIQHIINHSDAALLFTSERIYEKLDDAHMPELGGIFSLTDFRLLHHRKKSLLNALQKADAQCAPSVSPHITADDVTFGDIGNETLAEIVYTSGTTGFSKGVLLTHNNLMANVLFAWKYVPLNVGDPMLSFLPLAHAYGCAFEFLYSFTVGCHITFFGKAPSPRLIVEAFQTVRPKVILSVPLVIEKIYVKRLKPLLKKTSVKWLLKFPPTRRLLFKKIRRSLVDSFGGNFQEIIIGGAALNPDVERFFKDIEFPMTVGYGMTECAPLVSYTHWKDHKFGSVGQAIEFLEIKVDSADPTREVGRLLLRGENVMSGYYKNERATRDAFDDDGWLDTGDMGIIDQDGFIEIKGRSKNMILGPSGQNIYPEEIESQLNNLPLVQESLVLEKHGRLYALVYPDLQLADQEGLDQNALSEEMNRYRRALNKQMPAYCSLSTIELYPREFEKTPTHKIKRFLYQISLDAQPASPSPQ